MAGKTPAPNRMERKKEQTRRRIIEVAMALFQDQGFEATSMERIADEADIAKGTLYNHFPAKEAIVAEEIRMSLAGEASEWMKTFQTLADTRSRMLFLFQELMTRIDKNREIFAHFLRYRMQRMIVLQWDWEEPVKTGVYLFGQAIIELGQQSGELRTDIKRQTQEELFEFVLLSLVKDFYASPDNFDIETAGNQAIDLFLEGTVRQ